MLCLLCCYCNQVCYSLLFLVILAFSYYPPLSYYPCFVLISLLCLIISAISYYLCFLLLCLLYLFDSIHTLSYTLQSIRISLSLNTAFAFHPHSIALFNPICSAVDCCFFNHACTAVHGILLGVPGKCRWPIVFFFHLYPVPRLGRLRISVFRTLLFLFPPFTSY